MNCTCSFLSFFQGGVSYATGEVSSAHGALSYDVSDGGIGPSPGCTDILDILHLKTALTKYYSCAKDNGCDHGGGQNAADIGDRSHSSSLLSCVSGNVVAPCAIGSVLPSDSAVMSMLNSAGSKYKVNKLSLDGGCLSDESSARAERFYLDDDDDDDDNAIVDFDDADGFEARRVTSPRPPPRPSARHFAM